VTQGCFFSKILPAVMSQKILSNFFKINISNSRNRSGWIHLAAMLIFLLGIGLTGCQPDSVTTVNSLQLEEHPLQGAPDADRGVFLPVGTSQSAVLDRHREERIRLVTNSVSSDENYQPVMTSLGEGDQLKAILKESPAGPPRMVVDLMRGDELIFTTDAGLPSPALPLQSLWTFDGHWALEILLADGEIWQGQLYQDGDLINDLKSYQDVFDFQLLAGKPFFFFQKEDNLGYSYDGQEFILPYDQILHFGCCSASTLNPIPAQDMVAFYALTGEQWFYVELGDFGKP